MNITYHIIESAATAHSPNNVILTTVHRLKYFYRLICRHFSRSTDTQRTLKMKVPFKGYWKDGAYEEDKNIKTILWSAECYFTEPTEERVLKTKIKHIWRFSSSSHWYSYTSLIRYPCKQFTANSESIFISNQLPYILYTV